MHSIGILYLGLRSAVEGRFGTGLEAVVCHDSSEILSSTLTWCGAEILWGNFSPWDLFCGA